MLSWPSLGTLVRGWSVPFLRSCVHTRKHFTCWAPHHLRITLMPWGRVPDKRNSDYFSQFKILFRTANSQGALKSNSPQLPHISCLLYLWLAVLCPWYTTQCVALFNNLLLFGAAVAECFTFHPSKCVVLPSKKSPNLMIRQLNISLAFLFSPFLLYFFVCLAFSTHYLLTIPQHVSAHNGVKSVRQNFIFVLCCVPSTWTVSDT